ncbi:hypothetical protein [Streptomyces enissocaesilis]|uniref:HTH luxR-type domain-containing protein n=1 Tax=Streptomyces enissocaesilis TaxID=332589 RepID=A0ABP6K3D4_9ACTN
MTTQHDPSLMEQMTSLGLLQGTPWGFVPVLDRIAYHSVAGALGRDLEERALDFLSVVRSRPDLPAAADRPPVTPDGADRQRSGSQAVSHEIAHAKSEVLVALPGAQFPQEVLQDLSRALQPAMDRHVSVGVICQHTTRFNESVKRFALDICIAGGKVRTLEEFFRQLIIVDRSAAFISMLDPHARGVVIREPVAVSFLVDMYERHWTRAVGHPFQPTHAARAAAEVGMPFREALIRMLINGHPDKHISKRLGLSLRSTAEHVARLKTELGAKNRTEMGYLLAKRENSDAGISRHAPGEADDEEDAVRSVEETARTGRRTAVPRGDRTSGGRSGGYAREAVGHAR